MNKAGSCAILALVWTAALSACSKEPDAQMEAAGGAGDPAEQAVEVPEAAPAPDTIKPQIVSAGCAAEEKPIFTCSLANGKTLSVCATGGSGPAFAQYRLGKEGQPAELAIPAKPGGALPEFASTPYSGGGEAQLSFANGDVRYVVYSRVIRTNFAAGEPNNPSFEDGVMVVKGGKLLSTQACAGEAKKPLDYNLAEQYGTKVDEIFYPE